ncbi:MAG: GntR family transcriptional regulator [Clostridia bacterium]|nr:GntR family transcriptional regulator [Clostridia bacterium]MBQ6058996.1 GntR family transcriptional regulator [Clostridia bacterium]
MFIGLPDRTQSGSGAKLNLRNRVFQALEQDILNGKYPSGTNLTEKDLCEEFGVSRTPLREALCQLELEGLVECIPNKGAVVLGVSEQDVNDIYAIKLTLEGLAARLAAERITQEELTDLEETLNLTEFYVNKDDLNKILELDSRFHDVICKASKNRPLRSMMGSFHNFIKVARHKSLTNPGRPSLMLEEHRKLLDAISKGDGELASHLAFDHTNRVFNNLRSLNDEAEAE